MAENIILSESQCETLEKFRELFHQELDESKRNDRIFLLKWLIARDFDLEKARLMLSNALTWRRENNVDSLRDEVFPEDYKSKYPYAFQGRDKDGRPVLLFPWGRWNCREACESGEKDKLVRYMDQIFELGTEISKECHWKNSPTKSHTQIIVIVDMQGFSYWQLANKKSKPKISMNPAIEAMISLVQHYEGYYPETMHRGIIINAPWPFRVLFEMFKKIISVKTLGKCSLFTWDRQEWSAAILDLIDPDQLPQSFGGILHEIF